MRSLCPSLFALALACAGAATLSALPPEPDWMAIVGPYPQLGSPTALAERGIMVWLQHTRTQADVDRVRAEVRPSLGSFGPVLANPGGLTFQYPKTAALLRQAQDDLDPILAFLKTAFARPRPYVTVPALKPVIPAATTCSYPSASAALGVVFAQILYQFVPTNRDAIVETGALLGDDRVMAGVQWPSDVEAGQRLGRIFATYWIDIPDHHRQIVEACREEWHHRR